MKLKISQPKILSLRRKGLTLKKIGDKYGITQERVRQITEYKFFVCPRHKINCIEQCLRCVVEDGYGKDLKKMKMADLVMEGIRFSKLGRQKQTMIQKELYVKILKNKFSLNFNQIAKMLKRDRKTVFNLYNR